MLKYKHMKRSHLGFTLIEVMVALVILSMVVGSLSLAVSQATNNISQLKEHKFASWVAHNQLSLFMLNAQSSNEGKSSFAGINYVWRINKSATDTKDFSKISIDVANQATPKYILTSLVAFKGDNND